MNSYSGPRFPFFALWLLSATLICLTGCKSYQLGHPAELPFESLFVEAAGNDSYAPQAQAIVSAKIREAIIRDGRVKLVANKDKADAVLEITLSEYERRAATRSQDDTEVALDYDITLEAEIALYDQRSGEYFFDSRKIEERGSAFVSDVYANNAETQSLVQAEHQAMPRIARDIARKVTDEVLGTW